MGFPDINEENKLRIRLSDKALIVMHDDMQAFNADKPATFINTVFKNYKDESCTSVNNFLQKYRNSLEQKLANSSLGAEAADNAIKTLVNIKETELINYTKELINLKGTGKIYHLNNENKDFLLFDCQEENYYSRAGLYIKCLIEDYCSLPFIERERIYRNSVYEVVERACNEHKIFRVKVDVYGEQKTLHVYPYKIVSDTLNLQSYLICLTKLQDESDKDRQIASFSMARLQVPTILTGSSFKFKKDEIKLLEDSINSKSVAFLRGKIKEIHVQLTDKGKRSYQTRLYSRPDKDEKLSSENEYVFFCSESQASNYFSSFGPEAEIISPKSLRDKFIKNSNEILNRYKSKQ